MTKSAPTKKEISRREFLKNTAKIAIGAAALTAVSAPLTTASAAAPSPVSKTASLPVKRSTRNFAVNFDTTAVWDG